MSSEEGKLKQMKDQLEAGNKFKVLTQSEYEALLLLSNPTGGATAKGANSSGGGALQYQLTLPPVQWQIPV